jgi:hypothetical protein
MVPERLIELLADLLELLRSKDHLLSPRAAGTAFDFHQAQRIALRGHELPKHCELHQPVEHGLDVLSGLAGEIDLFEPLLHRERLDVSELDCASPKPHLACFVYDKTRFMRAILRAVLVASSRCFLSRRDLVLRTSHFASSLLSWRRNIRVRVSPPVTGSSG